MIFFLEDVAAARHQVERFAVTLSCGQTPAGSSASYSHSPQWEKLEGKSEETWVVAEAVDQIKEKLHC